MPRVVLVFLAILLASIAPRAARADAPAGHTLPVAVLAFDSEEVEENADALTGALRSRVRAAPGWSLVETTQSLGMLSAALKCPTHPPPDCQQRMAEQIKVDRFIWGFVVKGPAANHVTAEIHFYQRNKPDTTFKETYADNLRDPQDDRGLGKIARRIIERLSTIAIGTIVVRAPERTGEVIVDGDKRVPLQSGSARVEVAPGSHSVQITSSGTRPTKRNVIVVAAKETIVDVPPEGKIETVMPPAADDDSPFPTRKVLGGVSLGLGIAAGAFAVQQALFYDTLQDRGKVLGARVPRGQEPCQSTNQEFCETDKKSKTASMLAIGSGALGALLIGGGLYLLFSSGSSESAPKSALRPTITPAVGPTSQGLVVTGSF